MTLLNDLRVDIADDSGTLRYSDSQLITILGKAARRINRAIYLIGTDEEISVDASGEITPANPDLQDLVLLQAECMIVTRDAQADLSSTGGGGIYFVDGEQTIDTRQRVGARASFLDSPHGPCAELKEAILIEKMNRAGDDGILVW
jgi:hypothetical protein